MPKPKLENKFTFKIEPDDEGGRTKTVSIQSHNISEPPVDGKKRTKKKEPSAHLLVGFDTEYQSLSANEQDSTIEAGAKNELLSYQFSIKLITKDGQPHPPETDGIIIPDADKRLTLAEFIGFAVGSLIEKFPDVKLPNSIYLLGHFIRADFPAFSDFKDNARLTSNVRSTFVSIDSAIPVTFGEADKPIAEFSVIVRDTILLAPSNAKSLAGIGDLLGFPKIQLAQTAEEEREIKENMAHFRRERWNEFREYAIRDAQVCVRFAERIIQQSTTLFESFKMPATLTSFGTKLLLLGWQKDGADSNQILGRESIKNKFFSKKDGYFKTKTVTPLKEEAYFNEAFITETYHGGRNEQFIFGIADESQWRDHDLSSAYTTAMSLIGMPDWDNVTNLTTLDDVEPLDLSFFTVDFEFPESVRFPTLPVRTANGIIFPRKGNSKCAAPELYVAKKLGAQLTFRKGVHVPSDPEQPIFRDFIKECIEKRTAHEKGTFDNLFWKEVGNSTYGKTAQGLRDKRVYNLQDDGMQTLPPSKITQPYFASFITSYTRAVLGEILNGFPEDVHVFSVTTDGFLSNSSDQGIELATSGEMFESFRHARSHLDNASPLEIKHIVRQPVGWRTRGAATLKPGEGNNGIVLQKGGIKTNPLNDLFEENRETLSLFLNRRPDQKFQYKSSVGIKDMVRGETDFVFRSVTKRLSMEFDWKRKPVNARDTVFVFEGDEYTHLTFETVPVDDIKEFNLVRENWENYDKKDPHVLKSLEDFNSFVTYRTSKDSLGERSKKYLSKTNGDLKRLRESLTRAYQQHQAGFDIIRSNRKMKHKDFLNALETCDIPCKISDIDNGKKKTFEPHCTPATPRVVEALKKLKAEFYPELEIELFFPGEVL
ncbi:DNA polymerase [Paenochrobactrum sp. BZR 588]|uniref:DNA polymerase n=1 Tax=unclassified Paenochrobactrum TaxID=2639760 RepID=UPI003854D1A8